MLPTRFVYVGIVCAAALGCGSTPGASNGKVRVVATTTIIADAVSEIGGDAVEVETLMGPGIDPHRYTPTAGDLTKLASARVVFFNGLHLEGKMTDVLEKPREGRRAVAVCGRMTKADLRMSPDEPDTPDPHAWFDPELWVKAVEVVRDELILVAPDKAADFEMRATKYTAAVMQEHVKLKAMCVALPSERRILVTSHDAFGYFGARYGFTVRGLQGVSTAAETGISDRRELAAFLGAKKVKAVFTETSVPSKGLEAVLESVRADYKHEVKLVGGDDALYSDALGPVGSPGATYIGMLRHNVTVIVTNLK